MSDNPKHYAITLSKGHRIYSRGFLGRGPSQRAGPQQSQDTHSGGPAGPRARVCVATLNHRSLSVKRPFSSSTAWRGLGVGLGEWAGNAPPPLTSRKRGPPGLAGPACLPPRQCRLRALVTSPVLHAPLAHHNDRCWHHHVSSRPRRVPAPPRTPEAELQLPRWRVPVLALPGLTPPAGHVVTQSLILQLRQTRACPPSPRG